MLKQVVDFGVFNSNDQQHGIAIVKAEKDGWFMLAHYPTLAGKPAAPIATAAQYFKTEAARKKAITQYIAAAKAKAVKLH